ncbi:PREDICTED: uncharacterized protein LOC104734127 [Camelina sativa]|uniref:Uncharacterized protein LOC104734127 n=1 Tax=Camelina sativa TaxID=90675 RepID=A0ABM0V719_CAMSA|nr:PREDICTED: uncharacterized protein LOC104734127 [Camelina sativa]
MPNSGSERAAPVIRQDTATFSSKLSSTKQRFSSETAAASACPSFRIYYYDGAVGSVPFEWESHPGTPKHPSSELAALPPLTPPPSHFSFSGDQMSRGSKKSTKKILALIPTRLFWQSGEHNSKVKKLSAWSPPSMSERVLIDENDYDRFKIQTERKAMRRFTSFDSSAADHYPIRRSQSTNCFGIRRCFNS